MTHKYMIAIQTCSSRVLFDLYIRYLNLYAGTVNENTKKEHEGEATEKSGKGHEGEATDDDKCFKH